LAQQNHILLNDINAEHIDFNRRKQESIPAYIQRILQANTISESKCMGFDEMAPLNYYKFNAHFKTYDHTYYFAHSTGLRK